MMYHSFTFSFATYIRLCGYSKMQEAKHSDLNILTLMQKFMNLKMWKQ